MELDHDLDPSDYGTWCDQREGVWHSMPQTRMSDCLQVMDD